MALDCKSIGLRIKRFRTDKNLSQEDFGNLAFANSHHISNIEQGRSAPSLELLIAIANALDVSADDILAGNLAQSSSVAGTEIYELLLDCNQDEIKILTNTLKALKAILSGAGV